MTGSHASLSEVTNSLKSIKVKMDKGKVTNVTKLLKKQKIDNSLSTILSGLNVIERENGVWKWIESEPDEEMVQWIRETANIYKNYAN